MLKLMGNLVFFRECWRLSVPDPGYIIKVEVLHLELGDCPAADRVDIRDGKENSVHNTNGLRYRYSV